LGFHQCQLSMFVEYLLLGEAPFILGERCSVAGRMTALSFRVWFKREVERDLYVWGISYYCCSVG
jgi:hypothetical protein